MIIDCWHFASSKPSPHPRVPIPNSCRLLAVFTFSRTCSASTTRASHQPIPMPEGKTFSQRILRNTSHAWQELYNLFKLKMRMYNVHATLSGSSSRNRRKRAKDQKKFLFELKLSLGIFQAKLFQFACFFLPFAFLFLLLARLYQLFMSEKFIILWFTLKRNSKKKQNFSSRFFSLLASKLFPSARGCGWCFRHKKHPTRTSEEYQET
jgi:hypothetical protein